MIPTHPCSYRCYLHFLKVVCTHYHTSRSLPVYCNELLHLALHETSLTKVSYCLLIAKPVSNVSILTSTYFSETLHSVDLFPPTCNILLPQLPKCCPVRFPPPFWNRLSLTVDSSVCVHPRNVEVLWVLSQRFSFSASTLSLIVSFTSAALMTTYMPMDPMSAPILVGCFGIQSL